MPAVETEISLYTQLRRSLVQSGEWDQIQSKMRARLNDVGWLDEVKSESKENSRHADFQTVMEEVSSHAQSASLPVAVRKEIQGLIKRYLEKKFE
ncbi:hypothetical protein D9756_010493 [Leucocoprinus leucothites]|uniref:Transcription and mRNA export factor SUS1 n=1 Tax=Leucocoprinus leucothites TaxID=201217 RepID=A0A8H5FTC8_9AGAR|nr:hypothetical protein D9756_010493 [Leucoagaricus leucothites]